MGRAVQRVTRLPLKDGLALRARLQARIPSYLLAASAEVANPVAAYQLLTYRPAGARRTLELPQALEAARGYVETIRVGKQEAFTDTYPRVGLPLKGREQGTCFFATQPFTDAKNPALTVRIRKDKKTHVRCYLPPWFKDAARSVEPVLLVGRHAGTGRAFKMPTKDADKVDFMLDTSLFGAGASAEQLNLSVSWTVHDLVLEAGQSQILVGKEKSFQRVAVAEVLWDP